jgi:protoporphyrinogen oxidase
MRAVSILGAGISGLSTAFHLGHERCVLYEAQPYYGGHIYSEARDGFTWDDGPHVSFTDNEYVRELLAENVGGEFQEFETVVSNYFRGHWIDHPAQSNLYQVPEPLRTQCLESFLEARAEDPDRRKPANYQEWIDLAFGQVFARTFPTAYTRKYWTREPAELTTDWIGARIFYPSVDDVTGGYHGPLGRQTYWVKKFRYPSRGGFLTYARRFAEGARIVYHKTLERIHFGRRRLWFTDGTEASYETLVSTIPLPVLVACAEDAPDRVREAAAQLRCTNFYLVEVGARHPATRKEQWVYVYDEDKLSTRISFTEAFSPHNAPEGGTGMAVEVYGSVERPLPADRDGIARRVQAELVDMGLLESPEAVISTKVRFVPWGNVVFDHNRRSALATLDAFLDEVGVARVGRFAEWGYLMTHDCILRSRRVAERL